MPTLDELLTIPSVDEILDGEILPAMRGRGLNVTAWAPGDPWRVLAYVAATLRQKVRQAVATFTAAGFGDYAFGLKQVPGGLDVTGWAPLYARQFYGVTRIEATHTRRRILLTNASTNVYGPLEGGAIVLQFPSGDRYILDEAANQSGGMAITIPSSGSVYAIFRSEFAVDTAAGRTYAGDGAGVAISFVTAQYAGVTATNPAPTYGPVAQVGAGTGTLTLSGSPSGTHTVTVRIDSTGQRGAASWSTSLDGGPWTSQGTATGVTDLGGVGIDIALANGVGSPSFLAGALYYVQTPGSDVVEKGRDAETPQELGTRCYALWPSLSFTQDALGNWIPVAGTLQAYEALARSASAQVKVCFVRTSPTINNAVDVYVAGAGSVLSSATIATLQAFFNRVAGLTDNVTVRSPSTTAVTLGGATVKVAAAQLATAQAAAQTAVRNYLTGVDPKNLLGIGGTVERSYLMSLLRTTPGVVGLDDGLTLNGSAADLALAADHLATYEGTLAGSLTWQVT